MNSAKANSEPSKMNLHEHEPSLESANMVQNGKWKVGGHTLWGYIWCPWDKGRVVNGCKM